MEMQIRRRLFPILLAVSTVLMLATAANTTARAMGVLYEEGHSLTDAFGEEGQDYAVYDSGSAISVTLFEDITMRTSLRVLGGALNINFSGRSLTYLGEPGEEGSQPALTIADAKVNLFNNGPDQEPAGAVFSAPDCVIEVESGTLVVSENITLCKNNGGEDTGRAVLEAHSGDITIEDGTVESGSEGRGPAVGVSGDASFTILSANLLSTDGPALSLDEQSAYAFVDISESALESVGAAAIAQTGGYINVNCCDITGKAGAVVRGGSLSLYASAVTAAGGGEIDSGGYPVPAAGIAVDRRGRSVFVSVTGDSKIMGPEGGRAVIYCENGAVTKAERPEDVFELAEGVFSSDVSDFLGSDYSCGPDETGLYVIGPSAAAAVASVEFRENTTYHRNLMDAINKARNLSEAAGDGDRTATVTLLKDARSNQIEIFPLSGAADSPPPDIVIDFNGRSLTMVGDSGFMPNSNHHGVNVRGNIRVTLKNGAITTEEGLEGVQTLVENSGDLTLENMTLDGTGLAVPTAGAVCTLHSVGGTVDIVNTRFIDGASGEKTCSICGTYSANASGGATRIRIDELSTFQNVQVTRDGTGGAAQFGGLGAWVDYNGQQYGLDVMDDDNSTVIEFEKSDGVLAPVLPSAVLSYTAVANSKIVGNCRPKSICVQFAEELFENTWLWFEIAGESGNVWGTAVRADSPAMAWSFEEGGIEMRPADSSGTGAGIYSVTCYVLPGKPRGETAPETAPAEKYFAWTKTVEVRNDLTPQIVNTQPNVEGVEAEAVIEAARESGIEPSGMNELAREAMTEAALTADAALAERALKEENIATQNRDVAVIVQMYVNVTVKGVSSEEESLTYDITPLYRVVATTAADVAYICLEGSDKNAVVIGDERALTVTEPVTLTLGVPAGIAGEGEEVYIKHVKDSKMTCYYKGVARGGKVTFTNPHGFSSFTVTGKKPETAAKIGETLYASLQDAVDAVQEYGIIQVTGDCSEEIATVSREVTFTVWTEGDGIIGTINAGPGYTLTVDGDTYTVKAKPSSQPSAPGQAEDDPFQCDGGDDCPSHSYTDVTADYWAHPYIDYVKTHGVMDGISSTQFAPESTVNRATMATALWKLADKPLVTGEIAFVDVDEDTWYADAIRWAAKLGIINGYDDTHFGPDDAITREQMALMLYRYEKNVMEGGFTGDWSYELSFSDKAGINDYAVEAVSWLNMNKVMEGIDGAFSPAGKARRCELAKILTVYLTLDE